MPLFNYEAFDKMGKVYHGKIEAPSKEEAISTLRSGEGPEKVPLILQNIEPEGSDFKTVYREPIIKNLLGETKMIVEFASEKKQKDKGVETEKSEKSENVNEYKDIIKDIEELLNRVSQLKPSKEDPIICLAINSMSFNIDSCKELIKLIKNYKVE